MRTVYYGRVSTDEKDQLNSLQNQISFFNEFIVENGYESVDSGSLARKNGKLEYLKGGYADEGISGKSLKKREAFKKMILDAQSKKFDLIVTKSVARFGRSVEDTAKTVKDLKELGIGVYFLDLKINSLDNSKEFMINLFASLAQEESNTKSYITQFGIRKAQNDGKFTGQAPYGYKIVDGYLMMYPEEAEVVRNIYKMYLDEGCGTGKIARYLNDQQVKTKKNKKWSQIQVSRILDNPIYKGLQIQHTTQTIDINRDIRIEIPEDEWIIHQFDHLIIIDPFVFDSVQIEKQKRLELFGATIYQKNKYVDETGQINIVTSKNIKRSSSRHSNEHIFSNLVYCQNCGYSHKRKKRKAYIRKDSTSKDLGYEWRCAQNDMYGKNRCSTSNSIPETTLLEYVKCKIIDYRDNYDHKEILNLYINKKYNVENAEEIKNELEKDILNLERKIELNFELYADGDIDKKEYVARNNLLQTEITKKRNDVMQFDKLEDEKKFSSIMFERFNKFIQEVDLDNIKNADLKKLIKKIIIGAIDVSNNSSISKDLLINNRAIDIEWMFMDGAYNDIVF